MERSNLQARVIQRSDVVDAWGVEAIDALRDGAVEMAVFTGPQAKERAQEYARSKYAVVSSKAA